MEKQLFPWAKAVLCSLFIASAGMVSAQHGGACCSSKAATGSVQERVTAIAEEVKLNAEQIKQVTALFEAVDTKDPSTMKVAYDNVPELLTAEQKERYAAWYAAQNTAKPATKPGCCSSKGKA